jgi:hypothetical protein
VRHFEVTGTCIQVLQSEARKLYSEHTLAGKHTVLVGACEHRNSLPERRMSACDVLITVHRIDGPLLNIQELK